MNPAQLTITLTEDGRIGLQCNIDNKVMALGLLEMARAMLLQQGQQQPAASPILVARGGLPAMNGR